MIGTFELLPLDDEQTLEESQQLDDLLLKAHSGQLDQLEEYEIIKSQKKKTY